MKDRQLYILNSLIEDEPLKIKELSHSLGVSSRTVRNDLKEINFKLEQLSISRVDNCRGNLSLSLTSIEKNKLLEYLKTTDSNLISPKNRQLEIILDFLKYPKKIKIFEEQKRLEISKSTMDKDMKQIREYLSKYSLNLSTQQGAEVIGAEKNIRIMMQQLMVANVDISEFTDKTVINKSDSYKLIVDFFGLNVFSQSRKIAYKLIAGGKYEGVSAREIQVSLLLAIWVSRISNKKYISESESSYVETQENKVSSLIDDLTVRLHICAPVAEKKYLAYSLKSFLGKNHENIFTWSQSQVLSVKLINFMTDKENISYKDSEKFFEQLNSHITDFLQRQKDHIHIYNPLTNLLKSNYSSTFNDISEFFKTNYPHDEVSDEEKAYIVVYFVTYAEQVSKNESTYRIAVLCNYGEATGQLLATNIARNLNVEIVAILGLQNINTLNKLNIDFVVKTINYPLKNIPSFQLSPVPQAKDYRHLKEFAQGLNLQNRSFLNKHKVDDSSNLLKNIIKIIEKDLHKKVNSQLVDDLIRAFSNHKIMVKESVVRPMIGNLLTNNKIQLHLKSSNWTDAIEKAASPLLDNGSIDQNYVKAMEKSVVDYGAYIVIGPGIALAHARPEDGVNKLDVSVATLDPAINFGNKDNDPVKVIFVLAAIDNYSHLNILKGVINLIHQPGKIDELAEAEDINSFKNILFKKN
ncbi:PTS sugar transporter subunit IIA [Lactobacillus sp. ESL0791]|uniref:BglG family transcription antiterminator n=1 Tax=Lactobacillus sp. ESL0791 TaxID=2983234 RepID=UPI0023F97112|nr:PTS sugar transporter subunit IIA [Lactobacillus sp. ESL0791]MDF7639496.1 PTS sugar transporter subunit IIA [Lactobacillus sp. ESL0791]